jgi:hypothetical protein
MNRVATFTSVNLLPEMQIYECLTIPKASKLSFNRLYSVPVVLLCGIQTQSQNMKSES